MKKNRFLLVFSLVFLIIACLSIGVAAEEGAPTKQKIVVSYNEQLETVDLKFYIASQTAIVGYCSFDYDSSVLELLDKYGNVVPEAVPKHSSDGSSASFLLDVVSSYSNTIVTDVGRGADKLINTKEGYVLYAWMLPSDYPFIDASSGDVLISSVSFRLKDGVEPSSLTEDCIKVATKDITGKVNGWYAGLVVMNKSQKKSSYNGEGQNRALFEAEYIFPEAKSDGGETDTPDKDETSAEDEKPAEDETPAVDKVPETDDNSGETETPSVDETPSDDETPAEDNNPEDSDNTASEETPLDEEKPSDKEFPETDKTPETNDNPKPIVTGSAKCAKVADFNISVNAGTDSVRVKWEKPDGIGDVLGYTLVITDSEFCTVKEISGISGLSSSYTASGLMSDYDYRIYIIAQTIGSYVTSFVEPAKTQSEGKYPSTVVCNVFYNEGDGHLLGLSSELVLFGEKPSKIPTVIPEDGKYFIGWSTGGNTIADAENTKIYGDTIFSAVYSSAKPSADNAGYINGYEDGTFNPSGNITRAEAATLISRLCDDFDNSKKYTHEFTDCEEGFWYEKPVAFCQGKGYIKGYEDGTFNPYGNITRAEFATILFRVFGFDGTLGINVFSDIDGHWGKDNICVLYGAGIIKPDYEGNFRPDEKLTREDAVMMINRCLGIIPDRETILENVKKDGYRFSDVPQYSDSFYDIMAAVMN